jgi:hypothetical protein
VRADGDWKFTPALSLSGATAETDFTEADIIDGDNLFERVGGFSSLSVPVDVAALVKATILPVPDIVIAKELLIIAYSWETYEIEAAPTGFVQLRD